MSKSALLIEDDEQQIPFTTRVLTSNGFTVTVCRSAEETRAILATIARPVDLVVADRRLPGHETDEPTDAVGDKLLEWLLDSLPDSPFVVFTGFGDKPHIRFAVQQRGVISVGVGSAPLDRVVHYDKEQTIEFEKYVKLISLLLDQIDDVELIGGGVDTSDAARTSRRLLKRVALHFGGASMTANALDGGLTSASTWRCLINASDGTRNASVVVKQTSAGDANNPGGLHTILPAARVAAPVATVIGLCDNQKAVVMQLAGAAPESLMVVLATQESRALHAVAPLLASMSQATTDANRGLRTLEQVVAPFIAWQELTVRLTSRGIPVPRATLNVTMSIAPQHGDLHAGNILVLGDEAVVIDFDSEVTASRLLDPVTLLLSGFFHPDSALRVNSWPSPEICEQLGTDDFFVGCPVPGWFGAIWAWVDSACSGEREFWALVLGYATRQLEFPDIRRDELATGRALAFVRSAVERLQAD